MREFEQELFDRMEKAFVGTSYSITRKRNHILIGNQITQKAFYSMHEKYFNLKDFTELYQHDVAVLSEEFPETLANSEIYKILGKELDRKTKIDNILNSLED